MKNYLLLWMHPYCHDADEWCGIANSPDELNKMYYEHINSDDSEENKRWGLNLVAFEYVKGKGFSEISLPVSEE